MAVRTKATEVKAIMDTSLEDAEVNVYIGIANPVVTDVMDGSGVGAVRLEEIERWLTAHFITVTRERMGETEKLGEATIKYVGKFGMGLDSTPFGQTVQILDTTGAFGDQAKRPISINAITSFS